MGTPAEYANSLEQGALGLFARPLSMAGFLRIDHFDFELILRAKARLEAGSSRIQVYDYVFRALVNDS